MPVIDADAVAFGRFLDCLDDIRQKLLLTFGRHRPDHIFECSGREVDISSWISSFDNHHIFVVMVNGLAEVVSEVFNCPVPVRIKTLADDVVVNMSLVEVVEIPFRDRPVTATINMNYDANMVGWRSRGPDTFPSGFEDADKMSPLFSIVIRFGRGYHGHITWKHFDC